MIWASFIVNKLPPAIIFDWIKASKERILLVVRLNMVEATFIEILWLMERKVDKFWLTEASDEEVVDDWASTVPENWALVRFPPLSKLLTELAFWLE